MYFHFMIRIFVLLLLNSLCIMGVAQTPVYHQDMRYTGESKLYLDSLYQPTDSAHAACFIYVYAHKGQDVWSKKPWWRKMKCFEKSSMHLVVPGKDLGPQPLTATLVWYKKNPNIPRVTESFVDGRNVKELLIYDKKGKLAERYDYDKSWEGRPWGFYYEKMVGDQIERAGYEYYDTKELRWVVICTQGCYVTKDIR